MRPLKILSILFIVAGTLGASIPALCAEVVVIRNSAEFAAKIIEIQKQPEAVALKFNRQEKHFNDFNSDILDQVSTDHFILIDGGQIYINENLLLSSRKPGLDAIKQSWYVITTDPSVALSSTRIGQYLIESPGADLDIEDTGDVFIKSNRSDCAASGGVYRKRKRIVINLIIFKIYQVEEYCCRGATCTDCNVADSCTAPSS